jgi:hypothetical protein
MPAYDDRRRGGFLVVETLPGSAPREPPVDLRSLAIGLAVPGLRLPLQQGPNPKSVAGPGIAAGTDRVRSPLG